MEFVEFHSRRHKVLSSLAGLGLVLSATGCEQESQITGEPEDPPRGAGLVCSESKYIQTTGRGDYLFIRAESSTGEPASIDTVNARDIDSKKEYSDLQPIADRKGKPDPLRYGIDIEDSTVQLAVTIRSEDAFARCNTIMYPRRERDISLPDEINKPQN